MSSHAVTLPASALFLAATRSLRESGSEYNSAVASQFLKDMPRSRVLDHVPGEGYRLSQTAEAVAYLGVVELRHHVFYLFICRSRLFFFMPVVAGSPEINRL